MMLVIPAQPIPNQTMQVQLGTQACTIDIYQLAYGLFFDLSVAGNDEPLLVGVICQNLNRLVRYAYLGFSGDLVFVDTQGDTDPVYTGIGDRYQLVYLDPADLETLVA